MKKNFFFTLVTILCYSSITTAQYRSINDGVPNVTTPESPTAAGFNKFSEIPVGPYTGIPEISVPIYTINYKDLYLPINLSYHASGIKVEETASWVGTGWHLNAGGVITRSVVGRADDSQYSTYWLEGYGFQIRGITGYMYEGKDKTEDFVDFQGMSWGGLLEQVIGAATPDLTNHNFYTLFNNGFDLSPDIFSYSLPGKSGKFLFGSNLDIQQIPKSATKIMVIRSPTMEYPMNDWPDQGEILGFDIIDEQGVTYEFRAIEELELLSAVPDLNKCEYLPRYHRPENGGIWIANLTNAPRILARQWIGYPGHLLNEKYNSAWYLTRIKSANGKDEITLEYEDEEYLLLGNIQSVYQYSGQNSHEQDLKYIRSKRLTSITWPEGSITFTPETSVRMDVYPEQAFVDEDTTDGRFLPEVTITSQAKALDRIKIFNNQDHLIKEYDFDYSYVNSPGSASAGPEQMWMYRRLFLDKVTESTGNGNVLPPYLFDYNSQALPFKLSAEQDFWGYYNGNNGLSLIPNLYVYPDDDIDLIKPSIYSLYPRSGYTGDEWVMDFGANNITKPECESFSDEIRNSSDRRPNEALVQAGILERITYPTGGSANFEYESHRFKVSGLKDFDGSSEIKGGGLRIKNIYYDDGSGQLQVGTEFDYTYHNNGVSNGNTSGKLLSLPQFAAFSGIGRNNSTLLCDIADVTQLKDYTKIASTPLNGLENSRGSYVVYEQVAIKQSGLGKTIESYDVPVQWGTSSSECDGADCLYEATINNFYFGTLCSDPDSREGYFPYPPNPNFSWASGQIKKQEFFSQQNIKLREVTNYYSYGDGINLHKINGFFYRHESPQKHHETHTGIRKPHYGGFYYISGKKYLDRTVEESFDESGTVSLLQETLYDYDSKYRLTESSYQDSNNKTQKTEYMYPIASSIPTQMYNKNMISYRLEEKHYEDIELINRTRNLYSYETTDELVLLSGIEKYPTGSGRFNHEVFDYDDQGNVIQYHVNNGPSTTLIRGYNNTRVIAQVDNALTEQVAYTGFEGDINEGGWSMNLIGYKAQQSLTGDYGYANSSITKSNVPLGNYRLTFWQKGGDAQVTINGDDLALYSEQVEKEYLGWQLISVKFTINSSSNLIQVSSPGNSILIDDVRLHPATAIMTSYVITPLVGLTAMSDANNTITFYGYDEFRRLQTVKDHEANVLKKYEYAYFDFNPMIIEGDVSNDSLTFGSVAAQNSSSKQVTIRNIGNEPLIINGIELPLGFSGNWSGVVPPGETRSFTVYFQPATLDYYNGQLKIIASIPGGEHIVDIVARGVIKVTRPDDPEIVWVKGSTQTISWNGVGSVAIYLLNESNTVVQTISTGTTDKSIAYMMPLSLTSGLYSVKIVSAEDPTYESKGEQFIVNGSGESVLVESPQSGEIYQPDQTMTIQWQSSSTSVKIELCPEGGGCVTLVAATSGTTYNWIIESFRVGDYRIKITNLDDPETFDYSGYFEVDPNP